MTLLVDYVTNIVGCIQGLDCATIDVGSNQTQVCLLWLFGAHREQMLHVLVMLENFFRIYRSWRQIHVIDIRLHQTIGKPTLGFTVIFQLGRAGINVRQNIENIVFNSLSEGWVLVNLRLIRNKITKAIAILVFFIRIVLPGGAFGVRAGLPFGVLINSRSCSGKTFIFIFLIDLMIRDALRRQTPLFFWLGVGVAQAPRVRLALGVARCLGLTPLNEFPPRLHQLGVLLGAFGIELANSLIRICSFARASRVRIISSIM